MIKKIVLFTLLVVSLIGTHAQTIPAGLIVNRDNGMVPRGIVQSETPFSSLTAGGTPIDVFTTCSSGNYYIVVRMYYDLAATKQTEINWTAGLSVKLLNGATVLWTKPLSVSTADQTFISYAFHTTFVACNSNYKISIDTKTVTGAVPQSNVKFAIDIYENLPNTFSPALAVTLSCPTGTNDRTIAWSRSNSVGVVAYDLEWVFIEDNEGFSPTGTPTAAFQFKEPVRVTVQGTTYAHRVYYPSGRIYYRVRAVGYNPAFAEHRIPGTWFYATCPSYVIANHASNMTWQLQTTYAEDGKYLKSITYFDATLRARQTLNQGSVIETHLMPSNRRDTTLISETLYDFEGREVVEVLPAPDPSRDLFYKVDFNKFNSTGADPKVVSNTSAVRKKFHYDNGTLENSKLGTESGAGKYYSTLGNMSMMGKYIPDAEGYAYSQREYLLDGTSRVSKQSGVGKLFKLDPAGGTTGRPTNYFYGNVAPAEIIRLFGVNVGNATHYKKNMVVDPNGQASISYLDQEGRVVATALAGGNPTNVLPLPSYTALPTSAVVVDLTSKNEIAEGAWQISQKILNPTTTTYTFVYNLSALGSTLETFGCQSCSYDLEIVITDPSGNPINLSSIAGNERDALVTPYHCYQRKNFTAASCSTPSVQSTITIPLTFSLVGDYTITKILRPREKTFEQIKAAIQTNPAVTAKILAIQNATVVDPQNCEYCLEGCTDAQAAIDEAINLTSDLTCENILQEIIASLKSGQPTDYEPSQAQIESHSSYCRYTLCLDERPIKAFEKKMAMVQTWSEALSKGYSSLATVATASPTDPLFSVGGLGYDRRTDFQSALNAYTITIQFRNSSGNIITMPFTGTILALTSPTNSSMYINESGVQNGPGSRHILYFDLRKRYDLGQITLAQYNTEVDKQQWSMFWMIYTDARRKIMKQIPEYIACPGAFEELTSMEGIIAMQDPWTIQQYGNQQGVLSGSIIGPVTDGELDAMIESIQFRCAGGGAFTGSELTSIKNNLRIYFNTKDQQRGQAEFGFHVIVSGDLTTHSSLQAIETLLASKGCSLAFLAVDSDLSCQSSRQVTFTWNYVANALPLVPGAKMAVAPMVALPSYTFNVCQSYAPFLSFDEVPNFAAAAARCLANANAERDVIIAYATDILLQEEASVYLSRLNCLSSTSESLTYSYVPKEYHYTLYYYDQAGNLVQTVPPEGVVFATGPTDNPAHKLVTRYKYNAFNQIVWQKTPDAGESNFLYNNKGQIRISQNAQQAKDKNFSYTQYDALGRITQVGEFNAPYPLESFVGPIKYDNNFPSSTYATTDVTRTYYDLPNAGIQGTFAQSYVRNRVSYVEVHEKGAGDVIATYYSYDIHGNVKSLLQQIPGLGNKRTDYNYDLISGNVNFVFYQYRQADQFTHRYIYDSYNRIVSVLTSADGFVWENDATYKYYLHGPLARTELGHYLTPNTGPGVQGLDYFYTLQGWLKGVNMPFAGDPGNDGNNGSINAHIGRDVFSFTLGYYQNDYKPRQTAVMPDTRDNIWAAHNGVMTNTGLYNGNISWMITDLKKIGQEKGSRVKGVQAMTYKYDQLNRIRQSRSLTTYSAAGVFTTRTPSSNAAYDETFTYDANGNILTLTRRNDLNVVADNFNYTYYTGTNKLRYLNPVTKDTIYTGNILSNEKIYRNITIRATANVANGGDATLRATNQIDFDDNFNMNDNARLRAYVLGEDEGEFNYDAMGNLIRDSREGIRVEWTPYGKVRKVTRANGNVLTFRYDAAGNRIEKKLVKADATTTITRYVRDAGGNIMAVYNNTLLIEVPIYGSNRLGEYNGGHVAGQMKLGLKVYELANHLGNVLSTITDNVRMAADSTWATVVTTNDYYAFGLAMPGRQFDAGNGYRYGFNGQESDPETSTVNFDFREYNPTIARFISLDPIARSYPELTPYQLAGNTPIWAREYEGLEAWYTSDQNGNVMMSEKSGPLTEEYAAKHGLYREDQVEELRQELAALKSLKTLVVLIENRWKADRENLQKQKAEQAAYLNEYYRQQNPLYMMYLLSPFKSGVETIKASAEGDYTMAAVLGVLTLLDAGELRGLTLLPGELKVGTYDELIAAGSKGDNLTPHHIPSANHMEQFGVAKGDGVAINMQHPHPGVGGRHRQTFTYGNQADVKMSSRTALAMGIIDLRRIYQMHGLYSREVHAACVEIIEQNKRRFPELFKKQ